MAKHNLRIIPLGGSGEIGKNMTVFEYGNEAIVIDCGIMFPANDMYGVDYIIPDFNYLVQRTDLRILALLITHGHEDHIGAVSHFVTAFPNVPIYATRLTAGLISVKLRDSQSKTEVRVFSANDTLNFGPFKVEPFHVCHSIPDCVGFAVDTPHGLIIHTGDYKFDNSPIDGKPTDYQKLASFGARGVRLLMADSTNADRPGWTPSEATIEPALDRAFTQAKGRIMVATFASLVSRVQIVAHLAAKHNRKLFVNGFTMKEYVKLAREKGYLDIPDNLLGDINKLNSYEPHKVVIMVTGSQGEPSAVLSKLATGRQRTMDLQKGDTIILSSHPIPGNEESVYRTINKLIERGADVVYDALDRVHVSGHACQEEMRLMMHLIRPQYMMPVHGELRHLVQHGKLAQESGMPSDRVIVAENGVVIEVDKYTVRTTERIPGGYIFVDGSSVGDIGKAVIRDREILGADGFLIASVNLNKATGAVLAEPQIISRGFVYLRDSDDLMDTIRQTILNSLQATRHNTEKRREMLEESLERTIYSETKRRPMVFAIVNEF
ncbi:ribonuclease J [Aggregatilineales bacterium SYSU G02658]